MMKSKNRWTRLWVLMAALSLVRPGSVEAAGKITAIDFKPRDGMSVIEITSDTPLEFVKSENQADRQLVVDLKDAVLANSTVKRRLDTSSFNSRISLISPYQVDGSGDSRIVVQLREMVSAEVIQNGNVLTISVPDHASVASDLPSEADSMQLDSASAPSPAEKAPASTSAGTDAGPAGGVDVSLAGKNVEEQLQDFVSSSKNKRFIGKPITIQVRDAEILDVLQMIGEASGFNVVVGDDVKGRITLSLVDTPWDQALDLILSTRQLGAERNNNVLRVTTLANLTAEKQAELAAKKAAEANAPRVTRVFPVSYAKLGDLQTVFQRFASVTGETSTTVVQSDERTNSIIVRDTAENVERMKKLIEILDTQTPQVLIEAKIVEASENFTDSIEGNFGVGRAGTDQLFGTFNGGTFQASDSLGGPLLGDPATFSGASAGGGVLGFSPNITFIPGIRRINALLTLAEAESKVKIVSSPKVVVLNKENANIVSGTPVEMFVETPTTTGPPIPLRTVRSANLSLNVRPTVTNDSGVLMELVISRDVPFGPGIANRNMNTKVLVDSGNTLVIGGIYTTRSSNEESGFPVLRNIPILGNLFGRKASNNDRSELFIFITPRVLNEKEAGLS